jgi:hypothetical protein
MGDVMKLVRVHIRCNESDQEYILVAPLVVELSSDEEGQTPGS